MKNNQENKMMKSSSNKLMKFNFPDYGIIIEAENIGDANILLKKIIKESKENSKK